MNIPNLSPIPYICSKKRVNEQFQRAILESTGASSFSEREVIQSLWSGYGKIVRLNLEGAEFDTVIAKHVRLPKQNKHPRGWNTNLSHERKVRSYEVEIAWYSLWADRATDECRLPKCFTHSSQGDEVLLVLEDLDAAGYAGRKSSVTWENIEACLSWLAHFHALYIGETPNELWPIGTYWHLDTRPEELEVLDDKPLKKVAHKIDEILNNCTYKSFVHGDAKLANFCFSQNTNEVAAVDFQYVGGGCGMKDIAYFVGSCLYEDDCEKMEDRILSHYFSCLKSAISKYNKEVDAHAVEAEWRRMYPFAWTDFHRFLKGWSPGHWKINSYSERVAREVIKGLR